MKNTRFGGVVIIMLISLFLLSCSGQKENSSEESASGPEPQALSKLGQPLFSAKPSAKLMERFQKHKRAYQADPDKIENIIWYGRFIAYTGAYKEAIAFYTEAIKKYPKDPRLYRHRGHRYITTRQFDLAIKDLEHAVTLIQGSKNEIEPDGMPNARGIPVSTLHGNIWYHLGLAYYLAHDLDNALRAYKKCLATGSNPDNIVSSTHWLYMILRRLGRKEEAEKYLAPINKEMDVIENIDYHRICLYYKGELEFEELVGKSQSAQTSDAIWYAVGNWYFYNGIPEQAREIFRKILTRKSWASFGYIAAEAQYAKEFAIKQAAPSQH